MDEKKLKIKKYIEDSDVPADLKKKELEIVNNPNLSAPEVVTELTKLLADHMDKRAAELGVTNVQEDEDVKLAEKAFETASAEAEKDLEVDFALIEENVKAIRETTDEIAKIALKESLGASL
jgi:hypothetical protein